MILIGRDISVVPVVDNLDLQRLCAEKLHVDIMRMLEKRKTNRPCIRHPLKFHQLPIDFLALGWMRVQVLNSQHNLLWWWNYQKKREVFHIDYN